MLNRSALAIRCLSFLIIPSLILFCFPGFSQERGVPAIIPVTVLNVEDGLDQSTVYQVTQDNRGLIWLVSGAGLQYFDGSEFRSFYTPGELSMVFTGKSMHGIVETSPGILVTSNGTSVLSFNSTMGRYRVIEQNTQDYTILFNQFHNGKPFCWISSDGFHLVDGPQLNPVHLNFLPGCSLPEGFLPVNAVKTKEGAFLFVSEKGFLELMPIQPEPDTNWAAEWTPLSLTCTDARNDKDGKVYLLSEGIIYLLTDKRELEEVFNTGIKESRYLFIDRSNNFWVSDQRYKRIYRVSDRKLEEITFITREGKNTDTIQPAVIAFFEDKKGNMWFGTDGNGLLFFAPDQLIFDLSRIGFTRCISEFEGEIWAGTFKNGLWRLPFDLRMKTRVNPKILSDELYFFDLTADRLGRLWAATNMGVYVLNHDGAVVFHQPFNTSAAKFLSLPDDKLILSTHSDLYSCKTGKEPCITFLRKQTQIKDLIIYKGFSWVGNHFGLFRKETASPLHQNLTFYQEDRLTSFPVYNILLVDSLVWAGTEQGIRCYSLDGKEILVHHSIGELKHEVIYSLLGDLQNRIWFASNKGIGCIPATLDRVIRFTLRNNIQSLEFNFNADLAIPQGRIFFGGINGINSLNTCNFIINDVAPGVGLISLNISDSAYSSGIPPEETIVKIHWDSPHFSGHVFNPDYLPAGTVEFSFFLEGYQDNWGQPSPNTMFSYRNLPPGSYRLWVKCIDSFKNEGQGKCILNITIKPPFWKTWWFILISAVVVMILIIMLILKTRDANYRNMLRELEQRYAIDKERLRISQDMHDEIGSSLTQVAILSEIVKKQKNPEDMMELIDKISAISGTVVDDMSEIIWAMNPKNDNLSSFTSYLRQHASEYLSIAGIEGVFKFPGECPSVLMTSEQRRNIFLVVKEALHNVMKHSGATVVSISLLWSEGMLEINIEDNGKGFDTDKYAESGNGLTGMRKRIESLGGSYSIISNPGIGTKVNFSVIL